MIERDERGRFLKGGTPGPGRPKRAVEVEFHDILVAAVKPEYWQGICTRAVKDALQGDRYARQFIAEYIIGKPPQTVDLRAGDAALLNELLSHFKRQGVVASDVFNAMLASFAEAEPQEVEDDGDCR